MKYRLFWLCGILLSNTAIAQHALLTPEQRADGEAQVAKAGKLLADTMRDTSSTKFRNVFLQKTVG